MPKTRKQRKISKMQKALRLFVKKQKIENRKIRNMDFASNQKEAAI